MVQKYLLGMEDGLGVALIDMAAKKLDRLSTGIRFTDDVEYVTAQDDYVWGFDPDGNINVFTKDLVWLASLDIGYYSTRQAGRWTGMHLQGNYLYVLSTRKHDGVTYVYPQANEQQLSIRKFDRLTLQPVSEVVLSDPAVWDDTNKQALFATFFWCGQHLWINDQTNVNWSKIDIDTGATVDSWLGGPYASNISYSNADASVVISDLYYYLGQDSSHLVANFVTKTFATGTSNITQAGLTAGAWEQSDIDGNGVYLGARLGGDWPTSLVANGKMHFVVDIQRFDGPPEQPNYREVCMVTQDLTTLAFTFGDWHSLAGVQVGDADKLPLGETNNLFIKVGAYQNLVCSPTKALLWTDTNGMCEVDFTTGALNYFLPPWAHAYSSDSAYIGTVKLIDVTEVPITGVVEENLTPVAGRKVFLYDQATGEKIDEAVSDNTGAYAMKKFTPRPAFEVAQSSGSAENYRVNAHV